MPLRKYIERLERMDYLIRKKATGSPEAFARKMNMNRSTLMRYLAELKNLGAPVEYDAKRETYRYDGDGFLTFGFKRYSEEDIRRSI